MKLLNQDPDKDYQGAMFSPKTSLYAGLFLLFLTLLAVGRHYYLDVPFGFDDPLAPTQADSLELVDPKAAVDSLLVE